MSRKRDFAKSTCPARRLPIEIFGSNPIENKIVESLDSNASSEVFEIADIRGKITWINPGLLVKSLAKFKAKKSTGPDLLRPAIFPFLTPNIIEVLTVIYECCISLEYTPLVWRDAKVIFIPKLGKNSYAEPKAFRPISLTNYFLKGLERLCCWSVESNLTENPLHARQHGFLPCRSTETAISEVTDEIEKFICNKKACLGVFLDIKSAFDSINPQHVHRALIKFGADVRLAGWYRDYLLHRNLFFTLEGVTICVLIGVGFPQGGVVSVKFWLLAFDGAVQIINSCNFKGTAFSDDCVTL